jgi:hypothetical protein
LHRVASGLSCQDQVQSVSATTPPSTKEEQEQQQQVSQKTLQQFVTALITINKTISPLQSVTNNNNNYYYHNKHSKDD